MDRRVDRIDVRGSVPLPVSLESPKETQISIVVGMDPRSSGSRIRTETRDKEPPEFDEGEPEQVHIYPVNQV